MSDILKLEHTAMWCDPHRPNKMNGWIQQEAVRLTKEQTDTLRAAGLPVRRDDNNAEDDPNYKGYYIKIKNKNPVPIYDIEGKPLPPTLFIGNGSELVSVFRVEEWQHSDSGRAGKRAIWLGSKVKKLVKYDPDAANKERAEKLLDEVSGDGFVFGESTTKETQEAVDSGDFDALFNEA